MAILPNPNPIPNTARITFNYTIDPSVPNGGSGNTTSTQVFTEINIADLGNSGNFTKMVDRLYAKVGDLLTYTIGTTNTGNVTANGVIISDTIPAGTTFLSQSAIVNNAPNINLSPTSGVLSANIGSVAPGAAATLEFKVTITTIPSPNPIPDNAKVSFTFTINPSIPNGGSGNNLSNMVRTQVNQANLGGNGTSKVVDKTYCDVGETLTYTITVKNTGNVTATNTVIIDTIPNNTTFVDQSAFINNVANTGLAPSGGALNAAIGSIAPNATGTLVFKVIVNTIPNPNPILDNAVINYNFTMDPALPDGESKQNITNTVSTQVYNATFGAGGANGIAKTSDKQNVQIGETVTYMISAKNTGNTTALNTMIVDTIPSNTSFVPQSVLINGISNTSLSPVSNVLTASMGSVNPNTTVTLSFKVKVNTIPNPNLVSNSSTIRYNFTVQPTLPSGRSSADNSNSVDINVFEASFNGNGSGGNAGPYKYVDKAYAKINDTLTYTINSRNTGNTNADNLTITDTIPNNTTFIPGSVLVNGLPDGSIVPVGGAITANIGTVAPGSYASISFMVTVNTIPSPNPIPDNAFLRYTFTVDPTITDGRIGRAITNTVTTQVNQPNFPQNAVNGILKSSDKGYVQINDVITYTLNAKNVGNVASNNTVIIDTIPDNTSFVPQSVVINRVPNTSIAPVNGVLSIPIGTVNPNTSTSVTFKVKVNTLPNNNPVPNDATIQYVYTLDPSVPNGASGSSSFNTLPITISEANFNGEGTSGGSGFIKSVDKTTSKVGDTLTYTINAMNTGNTTATNMVLIDTIPSGTAFINQSAIVNGVPNPSLSPSGGILTCPIGTVGAGENVSLVFQVLINTIPNPNPIPNSSRATYNYTVNPQMPNGVAGQGLSNIVYTQISNANFGGSSTYKSVDKAYSDVGENLTYTIIAKNIGNVSANNVLIVDTLPNEATFVAQSAMTNGVSNIGLAPSGGVLTASFGTVGPNGTISLSFKVHVDTIPATNPIPDNAVIQYTYTSDPQIPDGVSASNITNNVNTQVNNASFGAGGINGITKVADKENVQIGEIVTYIISAKNTGNTAALSTMMVDTIPANTSFVPQSVVINGVANTSLSPVSNVLTASMGTVAPNATTTLAFKVKVNTLPNTNTILNSSTIKYNYTVDPNLPAGRSGANISNIASVNVFEASFNGNGTGGNAGPYKYVDKAYAKMYDTLTYTINARNTGNTTANNITIVDTIPNYTNFVDQSGVINGVPTPGLAPVNGVLTAFISSVAPGETASVLFQVNVNTIPRPNNITNNATVNFTFTVDPNQPDGRYGRNITNSINTQINQASFGSDTGSGTVKTVDKNYVKVNDIVTYTINALNSGSVAANNVVIVDTIPDGTTFVNQSVLVNGVPNSTTVPVGGVLRIGVGTVAPGVTSISFKVRVNTLPDINPIPNSSTINYTFTMNPSIPNGETGSNNSNTVNTQVNQATFNLDPYNFMKSVSTNIAQLGDIITYTIFARNGGNTTALDTYLVDTIPAGMEFVDGSAVVNNVPDPSVRAINGVITPDTGEVGPGQSINVTFNTRIIAIPTSNPTLNNATINYKFIVEPVVPANISALAAGDLISGSNISNTVGVQINSASLNAVKSSSLSYADVGYVTNYTITISNSGNTVANNVILTDMIQQESSFVPGSVKINNSSVGGVDPNFGITVGSIQPRSSSVVTFGVSVDTIPIDSRINNAAVVNYSFEAGGSIPTSNSIANSNTTSILVQHAEISTNKSADKDTTANQDIITYTLTSTNNGNATANNVVISDQLIPGVAFVPGSITVDGTSRPNDNIINGVNIGSIGPNQSKTVITTFKTKVTDNTIVVNTALTNFKYTVDPNKAPLSVTLSSNTNTIANNSPKVEIVKVSNTAGAIVGDIIRYTIIATNTGLLDVANVIVADTLSATLEYAGNLEVNGALAPDGDITNGVIVGDLPMGASSSVSYDAKVTSIPPNKQIVNAAIAGYDYQVTPGGTTYSDSSNFYSLSVTGYAASAQLTKSNNKPIIKVDDIFKYIITATNDGDVNISNAVLTDSIPMEFEIQEITIDGVINSGDIYTGLSIGALPINKTKTVILTMHSLGKPTPNPFRNDIIGAFDAAVDITRPPSTFTVSATDTAGINVKDPQLTMTQSLNTTVAAVGDTVTFTILVENTGDVDIESIVVSNTLSSDVEFIPGTVAVDGVTIPGANIINGVNIGDLSAGNVSRSSITASSTITAFGATSRVITFEAKIVSKPVDGIIRNIATSQFNVPLDPNQPPQPGATFSNQIRVDIVEAHLTIKKSANKSVASIEDTITYTVQLINDSDVDIMNALFKDSIPNNVALVEGSFKIDDRVVNGVELNKGVFIPMIKQNNTTTVTYDVKVLYDTCNAKIINSANATYKYRLSNGLVGIGTSESTPESSTVIEMTLSNFKQLNIEEYLRIPDDKPSIETINNITGDVKVISCHVIKTPIAKSTEGQKLNDYKLIIHGTLNLVAEYTSCETVQRVHSAYYEIPFSTYIVLPVNFVPGSKYIINSKVEDVYFRGLDERAFFTNTNIFLNVQILDC